MAILAALAYLAAAADGRTGPGFHTGLELASSILAGVVGILALARYTSRKNLTYLLIAVGFLGAALFDAAHTLTSSVHFVAAAASQLPSVAAWGWFAGRTYLAIVLLLSWAAYRGDGETTVGRQTEIGLILGAAAVAGATFLVLFLGDLPEAYERLGPFGRPYDIIPGLVFLGAFFGHWSRGAWREDPFEYWLLLSLLVHAATDLLFVAFLRGPFTVAFDISHGLKLAAYTLTLIGLAASMRVLFTKAEADRSELARLNTRLTQEVSRRAVTEEHLGDQKAQLESIFDGVSEGIILFDPQGDLVRSNKGAEAALGQPLPAGPVADILSRFRIYAPDRTTLLDPEEHAITRALRGEVTRDRLVWMVTPARSDGFYLQVSGQPIIDDDGDLEGAVLVLRDVTLETQVQEAAAAHQARLSAVVETAHDAIVSMDPASTIIEFNPAAERLWGWKREEILGQKVMRLMPAQYRDAHIQGVKHFFQTGEGLLIGNTVEVSALRRDGQEVPIELSLAVWHAGDDTGFTAIIRDIRGRKEAERRLQESEQTYRTLVTEVPDYAIFMLDPGGHIRTWNDGAARLTGYGADEVIGRPYETFFPSEAREAGRPEALLREARTGRVEDQGWRVRKDGTRYYAKSVLSPIIDPEQGLLGFTKITHDETERREAEQRLQESEERYRLLAENATDLVAVHTQNGTIQYASPAAEQVTGYDPERFLGTRMQDHLLNEDQADFERMIHRVIRHEERSRGTFRFTCRSGQTVWLDCIMRWMPASKDGDEDRLLATYRDVTAHMQDRNALARSNQELQEFAFIASHDLKEPLRKIIAFSDRIESECASELGPRGTDYLDRMRSAALRMRTLLDDLLAYSRVTTKALPFVEVDLAALAEDVVDDLDAQIEETQATVTVEPLPQVQGDPTQLRQLVQNLVSNALKYHREEEPPRVRVFSHATAGMVELVVEDNGIGFDMQYADRIFRPFQRLHGRTEYSGSGMGLAIVRKIAERHQGSVEAQSTPGVGSRFIVKIPLVPETAETDDVPQESETHA